MGDQKQLDIDLADFRTAMLAVLDEQPNSVDGLLIALVRLLNGHQSDNEARIAVLLSSSSSPHSRTNRHRLSIIQLFDRCWLDAQGGRLAKEVEGFEEWRVGRRGEWEKGKFRTTEWALGVEFARGGDMGVVYGESLSLRELYPLCNGVDQFDLMMLKECLCGRSEMEWKGKFALRLSAFCSILMSRCSGHFLEQTVVVDHRLPTLISLSSALELRGGGGGKKKKGLGQGVQEGMELAKMKDKLIPVVEVEWEKSNRLYIDFIDHPNDQTINVSFYHQK